MRADAAEWFRNRTYDARSYRPADVAAAKHGRRVAVVLPAHNEEQTVGTIVSALRRRFVDRLPLIDELVVIDSNSTDATVAVAARAGAQVFAQKDILASCGDIPGKGEALWKSLAVTSADVIAFVDSDLHDFDPHFAVGLLGPLLCDGLSYVKGCYDRPLDTGRTVLPAGGGRVTELVARPQLNAHWPELAGFIQPLAGEYAGTRQVLEAVPFVSGYGVEIGLLIDLVEKFGLDALGQVDLGVRKHRNSADDALARMAMQIQLTIHKRLDQHGRIVATEPPAEKITQFRRDRDGFSTQTTDVTFGERPPMVSVPGYQHYRAPLSV